MSCRYKGSYTVQSDRSFWIDIHGPTLTMVNTFNFAVSALLEGITYKYETYIFRPKKTDIQLI